MLPCNVIPPGRWRDMRTEVAAVDPEASLGASDRPDLKPIAEEVRSRLQKVTSRL